MKICRTSTPASFFYTPSAQHHPNLHCHALSYLIFIYYTMTIFLYSYSVCANMYPLYDITPYTLSHSFLFCPGSLIPMSPPSTSLLSLYFSSHNTAEQLSRVERAANQNLKISTTTKRTEDWEAKGKPSIHPFWRNSINTTRKAAIS